jgi:hypothetical protein
MPLVCGFSPGLPEFNPTSDHVRFLIYKLALGQVLSKYFGFPCQFPFHRLLHTHHLSSGAGTIGQLVADVPSGHILNPHSLRIGKREYHGQRGYLEIFRYHIPSMGVYENNWHLNVLEKWRHEDFVQTSTKTLYSVFALRSESQ